MSNSTGNIPAWMAGPAAHSIVAEAKPMVQLLQQLLQVTFRNGAPTHDCLAKVKQGWMLACVCTRAAQVLRGEIEASLPVFTEESAEHLNAISNWLVDAAKVDGREEMNDLLVKLDHLMPVWLKEKDYTETLIMLVGRLGKTIAKRYGRLVGDPHVCSINVKPAERHNPLIGEIRRHYERQIEPRLANAACGN